LLYLRRKDIEEAFRYFDSDFSGYISADELYAVMSRFKGDLTKDDVKKMVKSIDSNSDGKISIDGKVQIYTSDLIFYFYLFQEFFNLMQI
jgi:Ca2+-binding EF-hand superfamily protein